MLNPTTDPLMQTLQLNASACPQLTIWQAMHRCYSSNPSLAVPTSATEASLGELVVKHLLAGNRGHYSPLEVANLTLSLCYLPHSLLQQLARHRHLSFSVQSFRYTSEQFVSYGRSHGHKEEPLVEELERLVYFNGNSTAEDFKRAHKAINSYYYKVACLSVSPDDARGHLPFDLRQHAVVSGNLRAWWHVLDLRLKPDTQREFQQLALQVQGVLRLWVPQLQEWYDSKRATKAILSP